jgi:hypothetical protein
MVRLPAARAVGVLGTLLLIMAGTIGCGSAYAPPAGANTSPSNLNVQVTIDEAWAAADNRPVTTTVDLTFTLAGTSQPLDLSRNGIVVCQDAIVGFLSGSFSYRVQPSSPPSVYTCTYTNDSNHQKASFTIPREPAPLISSPPNGIQVPPNTTVSIDYQAMKPAHGEVGIALLFEPFPTTDYSDRAFQPETGSLPFQTPGTSLKDPVIPILLVTRRFRSAPTGTGFHKVAVLYDVYTRLSLATAY